MYDRRRTTLRSFALAALLAASSACSGSSTSSSSPAPLGTAPSTAAASAPSTAAGSPSSSAVASGALHACDLAAAADVQAAFGAPAGTGSATDAPDGSESICDWLVTTSAGNGFGVQLDVYPNRTSADWAQQKQLSGKAATPVSGLGDDAFSVTTQQAGGVFDDLWVEKGTVDFRVEALSDVGAAPLEALAKVVLARI